MISRALTAPTPSTASSSPRDARASASRPSTSLTRRRITAGGRRGTCDERAVPARADGGVERVDAARIAEHLRDRLRFEQLLVRERGKPLERDYRLHRAVARVVVGDDCAELLRQLAGQLVETCADQATLGAELDDVLLDLPHHASSHLPALDDDENVVEHAAPWNSSAVSRVST